MNTGMILADFTKRHFGLLMDVQWLEELLRSRMSIIISNEIQLIYQEIQKASKSNFFGAWFAPVVLLAAPSHTYISQQW